MIIMATISDYIKKAKATTFCLTKFLDTTESSDLRKIKDPSLKMFYYGGYESAERIRSIIINKQEPDANLEEFEIDIIKLTLKSDIKEINHRHVLGTLMSFGIKREFIGDIVFNGLNIYIFVVKEITDFILDNLKEINHITLEKEIINYNDFDFKENLEIKNINIASLRLDAVISKILNKSRNDAVEIIEKGLVQINHIECLNVSYFLKENDLISIRHFGRVKVNKVLYTTKKERLVVEVEIKH